MLAYTTTRSDEIKRQIIALSTDQNESQPNKLAALQDIADNLGLEIVVNGGEWPPPTVP